MNESDECGNMCNSRNKLRSYEYKYLSVKASSKCLCASLWPVNVFPIVIVIGAVDDCF